MKKALLISLCLLLMYAGISAQPASVADRISVTKTNYHGWPDALIISNGAVEAVIVPAIGRVMQFRFVGEEGPFWENRAMDGKAVSPKSNDWGNFGGDKSWPAPQAEWPKITPRAWPPPVAFDSMPVEATHGRAFIELTSAVDPDFGYVVRRRITLDPVRPVMTITTTYENVKGPARDVSVWVITQLNDPMRVFAPVPARSAFAEGYNKQSKDLPQGLKVENGLLSMTRSKDLSTKVGNDAGTLLWLGEKLALRIDSPRVAGEKYPDQGSSAEVYTNKDPLTYVELEMLGPLKTLAPGERMQRANRYTLIRRTEADPTAEARKILKDVMRGK